MKTERVKIVFNSINIVILSIVFFLTIKSVSGLPSFSFFSPYLSLGFLIIVAYLFGSIARSMNLPSLTGNLFAGLVFGPPLLGFITPDDISSLTLINSLALSFIAITAGGELRTASLKKNARSILTITVSHTFIIFTGTVAVFMFLFAYTSIFPIADTSIAFSFALLLGVIALANSPASTIAIINEYKARGDFTDVVLSITMLKDTIVLLLFSFSMAFISGLLSGSTITASFLMLTLGHILLSGCAGIMYGFLMILFFKYIAREISIFIIIASYCAHEFAHLAGLEHMFMCLVAGFTVQNFSRQGRVMIEALEDSHLPIYVVFFSIAGAALDFSAITSSFSLIVLFLIVRTFLIYLSTRVGTHYARGSETVKKYSWTGFVANAGLALSMLIVIDQSFPRWGHLFKATLISAIAANQVIGPVLFKYGLERSGESKKL